MNNNERRSLATSQTTNTQQFVYYIPIIGWLVAFVQYQRVNRAYWKVHKQDHESEVYKAAYAATWIAFDNSINAFIISSIFWC